MNVFTILKERGFIEQCTDEKKVEALFDKPIVCYTGFDPTGDSLHVGHLFPIMALMHIERAGHTPIALLGGGTAMVGDPSGKTEIRKMLTKEQIEENKRSIAAQMKRYLDIDGGKTLLMDNADWLMNLNYVEFLRDIGRHFSVNRMLAAEAYKIRIETGLSFIEFNYQIMQAYDFLTLFRTKNCVLQMGGNDQWGNILAGEDLIRRIEAKEVHAMTYPLLTNAEGKKMGKTEGGSVWLDAEKLSPFGYFQYWRNTDDRDVIKLLKFFTFLPMEQIRDMETWKDGDINKAKEILAFEATKITHGEIEAQKALDAARAMFSGAQTSLDGIPETAVSADELKNGSLDIVSLLVRAELAPSRGEAKRLVQQGGVSVNDVAVSDFKFVASDKDFTENGLILRVGKKKYHKFIIQ